MNITATLDEREIATLGETLFEEIIDDVHMEDYTNINFERYLTDALEYRNPFDEYELRINMLDTETKNAIYTYTQNRLLHDIQDIMHACIKEWNL